MKPAASAAAAQPLHDLARHALALAEHAPMPMAAVEGVGHIVCYVNAAFCRLMDRSSGQVVGKSFAELMPDRNEASALLDRVYRTGESADQAQGQPTAVKPVSWSYAMWPLRAGERTVGIMIQLSETAQVHRQAVAMNEALVLGSVRQHELMQASENLNQQMRLEVAERRLAEQALQRNAWRLRYATESARLTFVEIDIATGLAQTPENFAVVMGYVPPDGQHGSIGAKLLLEHVVADDRQRVGAALQEFFGGKGVGKLDYRVLGDDRIERWIETRWSTEFDPDGKPLTAFATNLDITERGLMARKLQEQTEILGELDRRKDEFLAMLSHELRNPLAPIANAVLLLGLHKNEDEVQLRARQMIERQVRQLQMLVDDLLDVSRITSGRVQLRQQRAVLSGIVECAVQTAQPLIAQRRHELTVSLPPQPIWVLADAPRLEQVLVNLLTNAAKYTDTGGRIWLTALQEGDMAVLRVRDNGIGIAPSLLPRIFELFTQAERSLDRSEGGLGIGLCLVRRLVELHGGTVEVQSVLERGSEFVVRLPAALAPTPPVPLALPASPAVSGEPGVPAGASYRVLVVDDNVDAAQSLGDLLQMAGHRARVAHDGPSALAMALDSQPDVMLLDIGLPGMTGLDVARRIRLHPALKNMLLIAMTGYGQTEDRQRSKEAGFDHHLIKPAEFAEVLKIFAGIRHDADAPKQPALPSGF